mmetsp:Transcript_131254/g.311289  ORF Transcript_131254/g.311289 Transcript_131254/m.311289 type:complete len:240 (-) Transcript_131254:125-844(-)
MARSSWPAFALVLTLGAEGTAQGALKLDNYTFTKVTSLPGWNFLVKFDQSYAYGEKEEEFKLLCKHAHQVPNFMVAEVPVQEYGDKENDDLRDKFKLSKEDFPAFFLLGEANPQGLRYSGGIKADLLVAWLRRQRVNIPALGTIDELDVLARKFMKDGFADGTLAEARTLVDQQFTSDKKAVMYVKVMQKIKEKGEGYVASELQRVAKIAEGKLAPEKKAELDDKIKILEIFGESKDEL